MSVGRPLALLLLALAACPAAVEPPAPASDAGTPPDAAPGLDAATIPDAAEPPDASIPADAGAPDASACPPCDSSPGLCFEVIGACDEAKGECVYPPRPSTWKCDDHDECTVGDSCDGLGACVGGPRTECASPTRCHLSPGTCDPATGKCGYEKAAAGASCDDGEACTAGDACDANGNCVSGPPAVCNTPPDSCHRADGLCNPDQGCLYDLRPGGSVCDDADPCTVGEACTAAGSCEGGVAVVCNTPGTCSLPGGTCVAGVGCTYPPADASTSCNDGDLCTVSGHCDGAGACLVQKRDCPSTPCAPGSCDSSSGSCVSTPLSSGAPCDLPNATAACDASGDCAVTACDTGFVGLLGGCESFGGAFQHNDAACLSCGSSNPLATGCACPAGFSEQTLRVVSDCAGSGTYIGSDLRLCQVAATSAEADYGGAFQQDDAAATCGAGCRSANPVTGACSCPSGTAALLVEGLTDSSTCPTEILSTSLTICVNASAPLVAFGGGYQIDDSVTGGLGCRAPNPRTNDCTCPVGTSARPRLRLLAPGTGGVDVGSNLYLCTP